MQFREKTEYFQNKLLQGTHRYAFANQKYDYPQKYPLKNNRVRLLCATPRLNLKMLQYIDI